MGLDAAHLKHRLWGPYKVLMANTLDGENKDVPIGFAICPAESKMEYEWFLDAILGSSEAQDWVNLPGHITLSDQGGAVMSAIASKLPKSSNRICCWHLKENLKVGHSYSKEAEGLFYECVGAPSRELFEHLFNRLLEKLDDNGRRKFQKVDRTKWADPWFPVPPLRHKASTLAERPFSVLNREVRQMSLVPLLKWGLCDMTKKLESQRKAALKHYNVNASEHPFLTKFAQRAYEKNYELSFSYVAKIQEYDSGTFIVSYCGLGIQNSRVHLQGLTQVSTACSSKVVLTLRYCSVCMGVASEDCTNIPRDGRDAFPCHHIISASRQWTTTNGRTSFSKIDFMRDYRVWFKACYWSVTQYEAYSRMDVIINVRC